MHLLRWSGPLIEGGAVRTFGAVEFTTEWAGSAVALQKSETHRRSGTALDEAAHDRRRAAAEQVRRQRARDVRTCRADHRQPMTEVRTSGVRREAKIGKRGSGTFLEDRNVATAEIGKCLGRLCRNREDMDGTVVARYVVPGWRPFL